MVVLQSHLQVGYQMRVGTDSMTHQQHDTHVSWFRVFQQHMNHSKQNSVLLNKEIA